MVASALTGDLQWMPLRWRMAMRSMTAARREGWAEALSLVQGPRRRAREALSALECRSRLPDPCEWLTADAVVTGGCGEVNSLIHVRPLGHLVNFIQLIHFHQF